MKNCKLKKHGGFTLVETGITIVILMITIIGGLYYLVTSQHFVSDYESSFAAVNFAGATMEESCWQNYLSEGSYSAPLPSGDEFSSKLKNIREAKRSYEIIQDTDYNIIRVKVEWQKQ